MPTPHRIVILNASILTCYGAFEYRPISLEGVRSLVVNAGSDLLSAIGHEAVAAILSDILGVQIPVNRIEYKQKRNDLAVVFKLQRRAPEGTILTRTEVEEIGYEFGVLKRTR
jgi:hypothetical protein